MNPPKLDCKIEMVCAVNLSEDPDKVRAAITNIFPDCKIKYENYSMVATSESLESFEKIYESIKSRQFQKTYRLALQRHQDGDTTWFYLNKQAAFANKVAICEEADESPLGPIKVILASKDIDKIIAWLSC